MTSPTLLRSVTRRNFLISAWPWRGVGYTIGTAIVAGISATCLSCLASPLIGVGTQITHPRLNLVLLVLVALFGIALLGAAVPPLAALVARFERWRLRLADDRPTHVRRSGNLYLDPATWSALAYLLILVVVTPAWVGVIGLIALLIFALLATPYAVLTFPKHPHYTASDHIVIGGLHVHSTATAFALAAIGVLLIPVLLYVIGAFGGAHAAVARALLSSDPDPADAQLVEVSRSRARLADAFDAERRRIERDLHDGAQQRLVNLTMHLGLAKMDLPPDSPAAASVAAAHEDAKAVMAELRDLIHGINPRTLAELGLPAALDELAAGSPVPVDVTVNVGRLPAPVERVAYFAVSEALTNVVKHSGATRATVGAHRIGAMLMVEITDDGRGGADPARGSGLTGLADRVAAGGGRLLMSSPDNGPTVVRIEVPCAS